MDPTPHAVSFLRIALVGHDIDNAAPLVPLYEVTSAAKDSVQDNFDHNPGDREGRRCTGMRVALGLPPLICQAYERISGVVRWCVVAVSLSLWRLTSFPGSRLAIFAIVQRWPYSILTFHPSHASTCLDEPAGYVDLISVGTWISCALSLRSRRSCFQALKFF